MFLLPDHRSQLTNHNTNWEREFNMNIRISNSGISLKTSMSCGTVGLIFLAASSLIFLQLESNLISSIIDEYVGKVEKTIGEEGNIQKKALASFHP
jgi:hypothetical protein